MNYQGAHFRIHQEDFRIWEADVGGDAGGDAIT